MSAADRSIRQVHGVLDRQRKALLEGRLTKLDKIAQDLEGALRRLARSHPDPADLLSLKARAGQNARLLAAARDGVAAGRLILSKPKSTTLATYDRTGARIAAPSQEGRMLGRR